jgi:hypothetical protein
LIRRHLLPRAVVSADDEGEVHGVEQQQHSYRPDGSTHQSGDQADQVGRTGDRKGRER